MTRKSTLSLESVAVINHLKAHGTSTAVDLRPHFPNVSRTALLKRLGNLVALGWLDFTWKDTGDKTWFVRSSARAIAVHTVDSVQAEEGFPELSLAIAAPRRINVMQGTYTPPRDMALRAGADHRHIPSHGARC